MIPRIYLYTRPGCHLCDRAEAVLRAAGMPFIPRDVSADSDLEARFGLVIPVVTVDDKVVFEAADEPGSLLSSIAEAVASRSL